MSKKKLLEEAQVRRMFQLAGIPAIGESFIPSFTIFTEFNADTAAFMERETMLANSEITSIIFFPDFNIIDGLVVTPSRIPKSCASFIWSRLAVSIKNFIISVCYKFTINKRLFASKKLKKF
mgnify:CR=1 FL=1